MEVSAALDMLEEYQTYWSDIYLKAKDDLVFATPGADQWKAEDRKLRGNRPTITVNVLPQFIHQVTNQIRQNTPSINIIPGDAQSSVETAKVRKGLIRNIQYRSGADEVYDTAAEYSVQCSIGFIRVDHDYVSTDSFQQELLIKRVQNPLAWWIDPSSTECDGSDSGGAIGIDTITRDKFEKLYPGKAFISFEKPSGVNSDNDKRETITIADVYIKDYETVTKAEGDNGEMVDYDPEAKPKKGTKTPRTRKLKKTIIRRYKFSGADMLEETVFPGEYIPLVPVYGQEVWVDGKRNLTSLIRGAKDPQCRYNFWASVEAEILAKAPIAPILAVAGTIDDFAQNYQNPSKNMVLEYLQKDLDGNPAPPPQRLQPVNIPVGIVNAMQGAYEDIKRSMGLYDASVGQKSNETSGIAIESRQKQGDVATFHFTDNLTRSVTQVGRILNCAIPVIYDSARVIQIIGDEEDAQFVGVNGAPPQPGQTDIHDLTKGTYDVRVTTGPSYLSKRQETSAFMVEAAKNNPQLWQVAGDLIVKNMDIAGADVLAERLKKTIPPALLAGEDKGEQAPDPEKIQLAQHIQEMQQQMQQMGEELQSKQADEQTAAAKAQADMQKNQLDQQKLALDQQKLELDREKLAIDAFKVKSDAVIAMHTATAPAQAPNEPSEPSEPMLDPNTPDDALLAHMAQRKTKAQQAQDATDAQAIQEQQEKDAQAQQQAMEMAMKQKELELEEINITQRAEQANALVSILADISRKMDRNIGVVRDANGMIAGATQIETRLN